MPEVGFLCCSWVLIVLGELCSGFDFLGYGFGFDRFGLCFGVLGEGLLSADLVGFGTLLLDVVGSQGGCCLLVLDLDDTFLSGWGWYRISGFVC